MIVLSQDLLVKSRTRFSQSQQRNCMDSKFAIGPPGLKYKSRTRVPF